MMAKKKPIETLSSVDLGVDLSVSSLKVGSHESPPEKPPGKKFDGADSVPAIVEKLRDEANVV